MQVHIQIYLKLSCSVTMSASLVASLSILGKSTFFMPTYVNQIIPLMKKFISKRLEENISLKTSLTINFTYLLINSFQYT